MKDIMGIEIENMSAASAVRRIMGLLAREPLSVCTVLRADMLLLAEKDEEYREYLSQTALRIVGDAAILKAMGEERKDRLEELENHSFQTQLLKELSENGRPVAVLTETEAEKEKTVENLKRNYPSLSLAGAFSMETSDDMDDAVNHINGLDAELVIAKLPSAGAGGLYFQQQRTAEYPSLAGTGPGFRRRGEEGKDCRFPGKPFHQASV